MDTLPGLSAVLFLSRYSAGVGVLRKGDHRSDDDQYPAATAEPMAATVASRTAGAVGGMILSAAIQAPMSPTKTAVNFKASSFRLDVVITLPHAIHRDG